MRAVLVDRIRRQGRISFADFMELVLYHPQLGYYNTAEEKIGPSGDYYTSPSVHPIFGGLIACQLNQMWEILGSPSPFFIIEGGAGKGLLCLDILNRAEESFPLFFENSRYILSDQSPWMTAKQKTLLKDFAASAKVQWMSLQDLLGQPEKWIGCFLSNELIDSLPVHRVQQQGGRLREVFLSRKGSSFSETLDEPSSPALAAYLQSYGCPLQEGQRAEINLQALNLLEDVYRFLDRGFAFTIDYGFEARELYDPSRPDGTLLSYFRHTASSDLYKRIGFQDITAHVNFTALMRKGEEMGLKNLGFTEQYKFLLALGLLKEMEEYEKKSPFYSSAEFLKNKLAMKNFLIPGGMGTLFKVLVQGKGVGSPNLSGFNDPLPRGG